jgi:hypothetical protein
MHRMRGAFSLKDCLHPDASSSTCGRIGWAHSIPRMGALATLIDASNHVLTLNSYGMRDTRAGEVVAVGWREASTFPGFCAKHDDELFTPIEKCAFQATPEQRFLVGYRGLCHEFYKKTAHNRGLSDTQGLFDRGLSRDEQARVQERLSAWRLSVQSGVSDNVHFKKLADQTVHDRRFERWGSCVLRFEGEMCVASAGSATPSFDLLGNRIQSLSDLDKPIEGVYFGMLASGQNQFHIVFMWYGDCLASEKFVESMWSYSADRLANIVVQLMFGHVENTFFSSDWWMNLGDAEQKEVIRLAKILDPEDEPSIVSGANLVPWKLLDVSVFRPSA